MPKGVRAKAMFGTMLCSLAFVSAGTIVPMTSFSTSDSDILKTKAASKLENSKQLGQAQEQLVRKWNLLMDSDSVSSQSINEIFTKFSRAPVQESPEFKIKANEMMSELSRELKTRIESNSNDATRLEKESELIQLLRSGGQFANLELTRKKLEKNLLIIDLKMSALNEELSRELAQNDVDFRKKTLTDLQEEQQILSQTLSQSHPQMAEMVLENTAANNRSPAALNY